MTNTTKHVNDVLDSVDPEVKITEAYRAYVASKERPPTAQNDLQAWSLALIKELFGASSFKEAYKNEDYRTLMAFGLLGYAHSPAATPALSRSTPVPKALAGIEPDFFPMLLKKIKSRAASSATFNSDLKASEQRSKSLVNTLPGKLAATPAAAQQGTADDIISVLSFIGLLIWATMTWEKKKSKT